MPFSMFCHSMVFQNNVPARLCRRLLLLLNQNFLLYWNVQLASYIILFLIITVRVSILILVQGSQVIARFTIAQSQRATRNTT